MDYLKLILDWFTNLQITEINLDKLKRQLSIITSWFNNNCVGYFLAVTGFGKTLVAIIAIHRLNLAYPSANIIVVVPTLKLFNDWTDHIRNYNLRNVQLYVINSYTSLYIVSKVKQICTLLIIDELDTAISAHGHQFNLTIKGTDCKMFLGMSATLEEEEKEILTSMNIPCIDEITMSEARRFDYISNYIVYNYGIEIPEEEVAEYKRINDIHNSNWSKFQYFVDREKNWEFVRACAVGNNTVCKVGEDFKTGKEWRDWYAETMNWNGEKDHPWSPTNIAKYANQWSWAMKERKDYLHKHPAKIKAAKEIIDYLNVPTITFAENTSFADDLAKAIGEKAMAYHSNIESGYEIVSKKAFRKTLNSAKDICRKFNGKLVFNDESKGYDITYNQETKVSGVRLKRIAITLFETGKLQVISTAKALDRGFNVENVGCAIICSGSSKKRQYIQRMGRSVRFIEGKTAKIINLYIKNTQDEAWLKRRQKGDPGIKWIENINQLV